MNKQENQQVARKGFFALPTFSYNTVVFTIGTESILAHNPIEYSQRSPHCCIMLLMQHFDAPLLYQTSCEQSMLEIIADVPSSTKCTHIDFSLVIKNTD